MACQDLPVGPKMSGHMEEAPAAQSQLSRYVAAILAAAILYLVYLIFVPFFVPIFWGGVLALLFHPLYWRLEKRLGGRKTFSAALATVGILVVVLLPTLGLLTAVVQEGAAIVSRVSDLGITGESVFDPRSTVGSYVVPVLQNLGISPQQVREVVNASLQGIGGFLVRLGSGLVGNVVGLIINLTLTLVALYYCLKDGPQFLEQAKRLVPLPRPETEQVFDRISDVIRASVVSTFIVAAAQGTAGGLAFLALGLPKPLLWGFVMGALSMIPIAGAFLVWIPAAIYLFFTGAYIKGAILVAFGSVVVSSIDNFLRPYLIHGRVHINNFWLFFGILGGLYVFGFTGLLLGPILVSLAYAVMRIYHERNQTG